MVKHVATGEKIVQLQQNTENIRNICILAHVDHGKTTLADALVASNGIISQRLAGKLRYMDSRKDEQERGITMKSSAVALYYPKEVDGKEKEYLVNLIDSPGHVDFSSEVSTALRLCDGAVVVVDAVEGVCPQTVATLRQAWHEGIKPVLVLNKIDRLILETKLSPVDTYVRLTQILEQVNAVTGGFFASDVFSKEEEQDGKRAETSAKQPAGPSEEKPGEVLYDWSSPLDEVDDSDLYFTPDSGNVLFASAMDGWGFGIGQFVGILSKKLGIRADVLRKTLWGDFYFDTKTKKVMRGAQAKAKKPLFVQLVLDNVFAVYESIVVRKDPEKRDKIIQTLDLKVAARDLRSTDQRSQLVAVMSQWLPLATAVLDLVVEQLPSPKNMIRARAEKLLTPRTAAVPFEQFPETTRNLVNALLKCDIGSDPSANPPLIVYISKMFAVEAKSLPENKPKPMSKEEMAKRREEALLRLQQSKLSETYDASGEPLDVEAVEKAKQEALEKARKEAEAGEQPAFIAFARVYSGSVTAGQEAYVLGPKHDPSLYVKDGKFCPELVPIAENLSQLKADSHVTKCTIRSVYLLMGRQLESLEAAPAGCIIGLGGLEDHILKSATVSSTLACPGFTESVASQSQAASSLPVFRFALEAKHPRDMPALVEGLKLLNQADACVQVFVQETGEHVIATAGEVHLERCLTDLRENFAKIEINVSPPIVPFRETVIFPPPIPDDVVEFVEKKEEKDKESMSVEILTPNKQSRVVLRALPLPKSVLKIIENSEAVMKAGVVLAPEARAIALSGLQADLEEAFSSKLEPDESAGWKSLPDAVDKIWSFGPRRVGTNVLISCIPDYTPSSLVWGKTSGTRAEAPGEEEPDPRKELESSVVTGFQMASLAGPICEEPMTGVAFLVEDWTVEKKVAAAGGGGENGGTDAATGPSYQTRYSQLSGQLMSTVKDSCRRAFQAQPHQRLVVPIYSYQIHCSVEGLGNLYAVLGKRHGRVVETEMLPGSSIFRVDGQLPVIESFNFAKDMRQTAGASLPQLFFSHWEVVDADPHWEPQTEEEIETYLEKGDSEKALARKYMNGVRKRKGLPVKEKLVQHAEKQRTLTKMK